MMSTIILISSPGQHFGFTEFLDPEIHTLYTCHSASDARRIAQLNRVEILFFAGELNTFNLIKNDSVLVDLPCISFGIDDENLRLQYLKAGSDFYLPLDVSRNEFLACLERVQNSLRKIEQLAYRDPLTGAYNRRYFEMIIQIQVERAVTFHTPLSLALLDIDRFKQINDTYGHSFGDEVLKSLYKFLNELKRPDDIVIRLGGEEFIIVFPEADLCKSQQEMNRILEAIQIAPITMHGDNPFFITFSAGVAEWKKGQSISEWLKQADERLYEAKRNGRNRVEDGRGGERKSELLQKSLLITCQSSDRVKYRSLFEGKVRKLYVAETYHDTMKQLEQHAYDLWLFEDPLAKSDFNVIRKIRKSHHSLRVIMVYPQKQPDLVELINAGVDECLLPPYDEELLYHKVRLLGETN